MPQNPQRVIVLDFGAADTLRALGVQDKIVGFPQSGKIPNYLSEFADKKYKNVGDLKEQSLEQINELNPDLIIASKRQEKMIDKILKKLRQYLMLKMTTTITTRVFNKM